MTETAQFSPATRFALRPDVAFQSLGAEDESVVLSLASGRLYTANASTTFFLQAMQRGQSLGEAAQSLSDGFEVTPERALADLSGLAGELLAEGLIEPVP